MDGTIGDVYLYHDMCGETVCTQVPLKPNENDRFYRKVRALWMRRAHMAPAIPWQEIIYNQAIIDGIFRSSQLGREVEIDIPEIN